MNPADFPIELQVILRCLHKFFSDEGDRNVENVPMEGIDWGLFLSLAGRHRVMPFLNANSQCLAEIACPESILNALRKGSEQNTWNNVALAVELVHLSDLLERHNIPCIAIKGTAQGLLLYGTIDLRSSSDIDVLVPPEAVEEAHRILVRAGYVRQSRYPGYRFIEAARKAFLNHYHYRHEVTGTIVELHWRLAVYRSALRIEFDKILENAQAVKFGDREVKTLSDEHTTLLLFWHGALHMWNALSWVCDVAQVSRKFDTMNWSSLLQQGAKVGVRRSIVSGLVLSNLLLGTSLPEEIRTAAERDSTATDLIRNVTDRLLGNDAENSAFARAFGESWWRVRLERGLQYKIEVALTSLGRVNSLRLLGID
jgi:hypothetical protein